MRTNRKSIWYYNVYILMFASLFKPIITFNLMLTHAEDCGLNLASVFKFDLRPNNVFKFVSANLSIPIGENPVETTITYSFDNKTYSKLGTIREKNSCQALNKYLGEVWYDIERAVHIAQVGYCPLPKGYFRLKNYHVNLNRLSFQALPKAFMHVDFRITDKQRNLVGCFKIGMKNA